MLWKVKNKLNELETSAKIAVTTFLILAGIGYIFGFVTILLTYSMKDQEPGLSVKDIRIAYYGKRETTALESSIDGSMRQYFASDKNYELTKTWLKDGGKEDGFPAVAEAFATDCNTCHSAEAQVANVVTVTYDDVAAYLVQDTGKSISRLVSLSHTHICATLAILFPLMLIFGMTSFSERIKIVVISISSVAIPLDIGAWWLAKASAAMAVVLPIAGAVLGIAYSVLILLTLYEIWLKKSTPEISPTS